CRPRRSSPATRTSPAAPSAASRGCQARPRRAAAARARRRRSSSPLATSLEYLPARRHSCCNHLRSAATGAMTLLKTRPNLRLRRERRLVAGEVAAITVEVNCPKPVPVDAVSLTLVGDVVWFSTSQYGRHRHSSRFLEHAVALLDDTPRELTAGTHRLRTR